MDGGPSVSDSLRWVISISQQVADEFPGMWALPTCGLEDEGNEVDVWISVKFVLFRSLHIQVRDRTVEVKDKIHPSVFSLSVDNTGESRYLVFNE